MVLLMVQELFGEYQGITGLYMAAICCATLRSVTILIEVILSKVGIGLLLFFNEYG